MTQDQIFLFSLFGAVFALLLWGRFRYDLVAFAALMIAVVAGLVPTKDAFSGFGHPATLVVALVLVVSAGLVRSAGFGRFERVPSASATRFCRAAAGLKNMCENFDQGTEPNSTVVAIR